MADKDEVSLVALLINASDGTIINAVKSSKLTSAIPSLQASERGDIKVIGRNIILCDAAAPADLFSLDGRRVMTLMPNVLAPVEPGVYVARIGSKSVKLIVK